jgi:NAD(P)-dependent dehydrogenase (short-subunit alcohol dehydrogenase family)
MKKQVYVFTGGGSGLALASAKMMIDEGTILLADLRAEALETGRKPQAQ